MRPGTILLQAVPAALVSGSYTLSVFAPDQPSVHDKPVNAADGKFFVGLEKPKSRCGAPATICPPGDVTTVDDFLTQLRAAVPGGQAVYVAPDGTVSYTPARSNRHPDGAEFAAFTLRPPPPLAESHAGDPPPSASCGSRPAEVLEYAPRHCHGAAGLFACRAKPSIPATAPGNDTTGETWMLVANTELSIARQGNASCVSVEGLQRVESMVEFGAWEYLI